MPNNQNNERHYDCRNCVNRASPLCDLCIHVQTPSGIDAKKPTYYIAQTLVVNSDGTFKYIHDKPTDDLEIEALACRLIAMLGQRVPIPTGLVMAYNKKTERVE